VSIRFEPRRQVWIIQARIKGMKQWADIEEVQSAPLELLNAQRKNQPALEWRIIRRTEEEVIFG